MKQASFIVSDSLAVKNSLVAVQDIPAIANWCPAKAITAMSGDIVSAGNYTIIRSEGGEHSPWRFGLIREILADPSSTLSPAKFTVQHFVLGSHHHTVLDMPTVALSDMPTVLSPDVSFLVLFYVPKHGY